MNKKFTRILPLFLLILAGCNGRLSSSSVSSSLTTSEETSSSEEISSSKEVSASEETSSSEEISSSEEGSSVERTGTRKLNFYALNDFHGAILETENEPGIFKLSTYLKNRFSENPNGSIHLNAGDHWQGSIESNYNRGEFLTKAMNELDLDAFTLGNHEFDWYDTAIMHNKAIADYPFLGANIINKHTGKLATNIVHYDDTFHASHMVTKNDVNVGIIGTIGSDLESSILGLAVEDYSFEPITQYVKEESENLKDNGADVVVLVAHDSLTGFTITDESSEYYEIFQNKYVDAVFSGHFHMLDNRVINDIPVLQSWAYGGGLMELELTYNFDTKTTSIDRQEVVSGRDIKFEKEDDEMLALFAPYEQAFIEVRDEVIGTLPSAITKEGLLNIANKVMHDYGVNQGLENVVAVHNRAGVRLNSGIPAGEVIFGDVYRAFPFDNEVMIIPNISGRDLNSLVWGDYKGLPARGGGYNNNESYTLLTIDFISYREDALTLNMEQISTKAYIRDLIREYFLEEGIVNGDYYNSY